LSNPAGRFDTTRVEPADDGWYQEEVPESLQETVLPDAARASSPATTRRMWGSMFHQSVSRLQPRLRLLLRRPTHAYLGLSPGLDFETKLFYKADAVKLLEAELSKPRYVCKPIALGINTDGYQPLERRLGVTRSILEVLAAAGTPYPSSRKAR